jgi:phosphonate transport system substrate-binding protein
MSHFRHFCIRLLLLTVLIPASAAAAAAPSGTIVVGVVPEINLVRQMDRYAPLAAYLEKKTGMDIEVKPLANYGNLYEEMRDGKIDAGFFGSLLYGIARARIGIEPLARTVQPNGKSTYTALLFVNRDAGIKKPADMKGKTIALVDPATAAGYLAQRAYFAMHGIDMEKELTIYWAGSHEAAVRAVLNHTADIGGAKNTVVARFRKENRAFDTLVDIINESPKKGLPDNTFAVRKGLEQATRETLQKTLLAMNSDPEGKNVLAKFGALRFIATSDADFTPLYDWCRHLKIDLASYNYKKARQ